jgi:anionic cell wall polymer biosynthesis LytR-Cps2A-Psr (LCP) family protein
MRGNTVRKQVFVYAGIAVALAAAVVVWLLLGQRNLDRLFEQDERANVVLVGRDAGGTVDLVTLLSFSKEDAVLFALPTDLRVRDDSGSFRQLGALCSDAGAEAGTKAIGALLGIDIPFYVAFEDASLSSWIDDLGGLTISLDASAMYLDASVDPAMQVEIRPGDQVFDGAGALAFATAPSAEGDIGLLDRQGEFLRAMLVAGIDEQSLRSVRNGIRSSASEWETNISQSELLDAVEALHSIPQDAVRSDEVEGEIVDIDGVTYTQPSVVETERIVAAALRGLNLLTPGDVKVAVFNGNGVRLMARKTADYLLARGFQVTAIGNADTFGYETSYVIVLSDESKAWVLRDALPSAVQIVFPETFTTHYEALKDYIPAGTDIVLIAGAGLEIQ